MMQEINVYPYTLSNLATSGHALHILLFFIARMLLKAVLKLAI